MEIKCKYFKLTPFGKLLVFLSLFFIVIIIPVVVDAYLGPDKFCLDTASCASCTYGQKCIDNRPGYDAYCEWQGDNCRDLGKVSEGCTARIKVCEYRAISTSTYKACNANDQCVSVTGTGSDVCTTNADCSTATHKACNANDHCVSVTGAGDDECTNDANCTTATHKECNNNHTGCISVAGAGADQCTTDASCAITHKECNANHTGCISVTGAGANECTTDANCTTATHKECNNNHTGCISVAGAGADQCTTDASCNVSPPTENGSIKVKARLDGNTWTGTVNYTLSGPETINGTAVTTNHYGVPVGTYTISVTSGGPDNALFDHVSGGPSLLVLANEQTIFILNFVTYTGPYHKACNISSQCITVIGGGADTCTDDVSCGAGASHKECNVSKQCIAVAGSGADTCTDDVSCGGGVFHKVCNASDRCVSVAGSGPDQCINDTSCDLPSLDFVCNFSWSPESPKAKSAVNFFDNTQTPEGTILKYWDWIFESGTPAISSVQNPGGVIFNSAGEKTVTLSATNSDNEVCTLSQEITVQSLNPKWIEVLPK